MTRFVGDLMYPSEKYLSNGEEKTRWLNCGGLFESDDGRFSVKITAMPTVMEAGNWFRVFPKRDGDNKPATQTQPKPKQEGFDDDDIPF